MRYPQRALGETFPTSSIDYAPIRRAVIEIMRQAGEQGIKHEDLVQAAIKAPTNKRSALKVIKWLAEDRVITRPTNRYPWRLT